MDFWPWFLFSIFLLICALGLTLTHVRTWRRVLGQAAQIEPKELEYRRRQFRRRVQSTAMLGLLAVGLLAGYWVRPPRVATLSFSVYWGGMLFVVFWVALLAIVDMIATRFHYSRLQRDCLMEEVKLRAELRRLRATAGVADAKPDAEAGPDAGPDGDDEGAQPGGPDSST